MSEKIEEVKKPKSMVLTILKYRETGSSLKRLEEMDHHDNSIEEEYGYGGKQKNSKRSRNRYGDE